MIQPCATYPAPGVRRRWSPHSQSGERLGSWRHRVSSPGSARCSVVASRSWRSPVIGLVDGQISAQQTGDLPAAVVCGSGHDLVMYQRGRDRIGGVEVAGHRQMADAWDWYCATSVADDMQPTETHDAQRTRRAGTYSDATGAARGPPSFHRPPAGRPEESPAPRAVRLNNHRRCCRFAVRRRP